MTKKNHFNAESYLKNFEHIPRSEACFSTNRILKKDKVGWSTIGKKPINVSGLCYSMDFYTDFTEKGADREKFETLFKKSFEDDWPKIVRKIINIANPAVTRQVYDKTEVLSEKEMKTLIKFIIVQHKRTPRIRDLFIKSNARIPKKVMTKMKKENPRASKEQIMEMFFHKTHLYFLENDQPGTELMLQKLNWGLVINSTKTPFITSDAPVLWLDEIKVDGISGIFVPITPNIAIFIPVNLHYAQRKIVLRHIDENFAKEINNGYKNRAIRVSRSYSRLISNDRKTLVDLVNN